MLKAVYDTNVLVSAFLTRHHPGGIATEMLRAVESGVVELCLSPAIVEETATTLLRSAKLQARYQYTPQMATQYCVDLLAVATIFEDPPALPSAASRDPEDDKIIACAVAARADYLVSRDLDLLSLESYGSVAIISPEAFMARLRIRPP